MSGLQKDARGFVVGPNQNSFQSFPAVASDGQSFLVVWNERLPTTPVRYELKARRIIGGGPQFEPILTLENNLDPDSRPAVAWGGASYLVVWESRRATEKFLAASLITPEGIVLSPAGFEVSTSFGRNPSLPDIVWSGTHFMVVWGEGDRATDCGMVICPFGPMTDIRGRRVSANGFIFDPEAIEISSSDELQIRPTVAWDGSSHLVTWSRVENGSEIGIVGRRVSSEGIVLFPDEPPIFLVPQTGEELIHGEVASDGTGFLIAWQVALPDDSVWGSRVAPNGSPIDLDRTGGGFPISREREDEDDISVLVRPDGRALVSYRREVANDPCGASRVAFRILGEPVLEPEPEPEPEPERRRLRPAKRP
ncbi:MAG TPA: hypothetical protein VMS12_00885 [Thermoanaerobaculia bacterium]|nr:hypothetical protein [Thermoanaerobaculia bacterium]